MAVVLEILLILFPDKISYVLDTLNYQSNRKHISLNTLYKFLRIQHGMHLFYRRT